MQFADESKTVRLRWKTSVIPIAVSASLVKQKSNIKSDEDVLTIVRRSFDAWEKVANIRFEITVVDKQSVSPAGKSGDGTSLVTIAQTPENLLLFSGDSEEVSARTRTFFNGKGTITEADIVLNPYQQFSTDGSIGTFDLEATLTHEIGHLLGLEHSLIPGATMFGHQARNGIYGLPAVGARVLSEDDDAGIRALYGAKNAEAACCGTIAGKLSAANGRAARETQIWIEDAEDGRVAAGTLTNADGGFRLEGLTSGKYFIYAQEFGERKNSIASKLLGELEVSKGKTVNFVKKLKNIPKTLDVSYIGFNGQLSGLAVPLNGGKSFIIYVGGKNLDADNLQINFNSPNFSATPNSITRQDFGSGSSVISFEVNVESQTPAGEYSFSLRAKNGETVFIVGGLTIDGFVNPWSSFQLTANE